MLMRTKRISKVLVASRACSRSLVDRVRLAIFLIACTIGCGDCQEGLFPPTRLGRNLAPFNRVRVTSVCGDFEEGVGQAANYCAPDGFLLSCRGRICRDGGCLYASRISNGIDVLEEGTVGQRVMVSFLSHFKY